jgi:dihydrofolate reductase
LPKLTLTQFLTLDGVMQSPGMPEEDPRSGFRHGGWQVPYFDDDLMRIHSEDFAAAGGLVLGRKTYEIFAGYWPHVTDEGDLIAAKLNSLPKYVVSTTLDTVEWNNSTLIKDNVLDEIAALKRKPGGELQIHGSGALARTLMEHELIDEYRLWIYPVVLGSGRRLFADGGLPTALRLIDTTKTGSGAVLHVYEPVGRPSYGTTALDQ